MKIKLVGASLFGLMLFFASATQLLADDSEEAKPSPFKLPDTMVGDLFAVFCYGILAIALIVIGYKVFDAATPGIQFEQHVSNGNLPAAIVFASLILGLSYVIAHVVAAIMGLRT